MDKFAIGEQALFVKNPDADETVPRIAEHHNTVCVVLSAPKFGWEYLGGYGYRVRFFDGFETDVAIICLRKMPPPEEKKREEVGEWELCPWRPRTAVTVTPSQP